MKPAEPSPQYGWQRAIYAAGIGLFVALTGSCAVAVYWWMSTGHHVGTAAVIFLCSTVASILPWKWYFDRPGELRKRLPVTSKELRQAKKDFYDDLRPNRRC